MELLEIIFSIDTIIAWAILFVLIAFTLVLIEIIKGAIKYPSMAVCIAGWICVFGIVGYVGYETNRNKIIITEWQNNGWVDVVVNANYYPTSTSDGGYYIKEKEIIADGACVEKAQTILNILKRKYKDYHQIRIADTPIHVQVVRLNKNGKIDFLDLDGVNVIIGFNEFESWGINGGNFKLIDPDQFLIAIEIYKPLLYNYQLNTFLSKNKRDIK